MVYLAKGGSWLTLGKIIGSISSFAMAIAFANLLSKESYGLYKYVLSIAGLISIAALPGMNTALARSVAMGNEGSLFPALRSKLKWALMGSLACIGISIYYFYKNNYLLGNCFLIVSIFTPFINGYFTYGHYLQGKKNFRKLSLFTIIYNLSFSILLIISLFITKKIFFIILIYFAASLIIQIIIFIITFKNARLNERSDPKTISYGKHLSFMDILGITAEHIDKILLWHLLGPAQVAVYSFAIAPVSQIRSVFRTLNPLALPKFANSDELEIKKTLSIKVLKLSLLLVIIAASYMFAAAYLYRIFFPQYLEAIKYTKIYSIILIFTPISLFGTALAAKMQTKSLYVLKISSPIVKILLILVLTRLYGLFGIILALILHTIVNGGLVYCLFRKI